METLSLKAYNIIKEMILNDELKQGQLISINNLSSELNISRTPLSNAFQRLEYEKLITIVPKQGVIVNTISLETAREIYELRAAIESYNAKRAFSILTPKDIEWLSSSIEKQLECLLEPTPNSFMKEDSAFHTYILKKVSNCEFLSLIEELYDRSFLLGIKNSSKERMIEAVEEHRKILESLTKGNKQDFADAIEFNILNGYRNLTKQIYPL